MGKPTLFTRGNGRKGQDISHAIKYLNLPDKPNLEIRGELLMRKQIFDMNWSDRFKNVRNMIAGTANAKESFPERWSDIDFVAYEIVSPELKPSEQFKLLKALNCVTVINKGLKKINKDNLSKYLLKIGVKTMTMILMVLLLLMIKNILELAEIQNIHLHLRWF